MILLHFLILSGAFSGTFLGTFLLCSSLLTHKQRHHHRLRLFGSNIDAHVIKSHVIPVTHSMEKQIVEEESIAIPIAKNENIGKQNIEMQGADKQNTQYTQNSKKNYVKQVYPKKQAEMAMRTEEIKANNGNTRNTTNNERNIEKVERIGKKADNSTVVKADPRAINKRIVETFSTSFSKPEIEKLRRYLQQNLQHLNQINVITLMHRCAKNKLDFFSFIDVDHTVKLLDVKRSGVATSQGIANAVYSLQSMTSFTPGALSLLHVLSEQLVSCREIFDGQAISNTLYGLKGMNSESPEVSAMLSAVVTTIRRGLQSHISGREGGRDGRDSDRNDRGGDRGERGERERDSRERESRDRAGNRNGVPVSNLRMTPQGIGAAFIGLQGMSSSNSDVRAILSVLADCVAQLTATNIALDSQAVANILVGLKISSSDHAEVREVLVALSRNLKRNLSVFKGMQPRELSMSLAGLQGMSSDHPQVDQLLEVLCDGLDYRLDSYNSNSNNYNRASNYGNNYNNNYNNGNGNGYNNGSTSGSSNMRRSSVFEFSSGDEVGPALGGLKQMSAENVQVKRLLRHIGRAMGIRREGGGGGGGRGLDRWGMGVRGTGGAGQNSVSSSGSSGSSSGSGYSSSSSSSSSAHSNRWNRGSHLNMNEQNIANSLYGLQSMDCRSEEVRAILSALSREIMAFEGTLSGRTIANSLYGKSSH